MPSPATVRPPTACLALADGTLFYGQGFGGTGTTTAELCFNTAMTGYQEILTDPSYRGQIVTMTYPEIGNYGVNAEDVESWKPHLAGFVGIAINRRLGVGPAARAADCVPTPPPPRWAP